MHASPITRASDATTVARYVLGRLERAWNDGDGAGFGAVYAVDASFVTVRGEHLVGGAAIGAGHDGIFRSIYAGSVNHMELVRAEHLAEDVLLVVSRHTLRVPAGPLAGRHQAFSTSVIVRDTDGGWLVASSHNSLVAG